ncbi:MAG TPA: hypothetical protein DIU15_11905 [Deltaproteobacteria bacterium]|nr:hypothetical protein [Deltaproteobacteria bacterium]HCP46742.1 hypothetical protein [Deltaproteobacteria bacterium]
MPDNPDATDRRPPERARALFSDTNDDDSGPRWTRRHVLAASSAVAIAGSLGAAGRVISYWDRASGAAFQTLADHEGEIIDALAEAMFPPGGTPALSGREAGIAAFLDQVLTDMPEPTDDLLRALLHGLDDWARLSRGRGYCALSLETRSERLESWLAHPRHEVRGAIRSLMLFVSMGYCGHPAVKDACGWVFPCGYEL